MGYKTTSKQEKEELEKDGGKLIGYTIDPKTKIETYEFDIIDAETTDRQKETEDQPKETEIRILSPKKKKRE
jgi:hypothetical protein